MTPVPSSARHAARQVGTAALRAALPQLTRLPHPGASPRNDRGARLDRELDVLLRWMARGQRPLEEMSPREARETYRFGVALLGPRATRPVQMISAEGLPIRIHRADVGSRDGAEGRRSTAHGSRLRPAVVFFHGGGFVIGDAAEYDGVVQSMVRDSGCTFVAVPYRKAPEHPFPAGIEDANRGYRWVVDNAPRLGLDPERIAVMGDSAGATLAINVAQSAATAGRGRPALQCLVYPAVDFHGAVTTPGSGPRYPSREAFANGYILTRDTIEYFARHYVAGPVDAADPRLVPLAYPHPERMPPTLLVTAGFDPLRDEGEAYAERLTSAGVPVRHLEWPELVHGAFTMGGALRAPRRRVARLAATLGRMLRDGTTLLPRPSPDRGVDQREAATAAAGRRSKAS
ncbi:MAG: alpha/beta hydrolase [Myxococcota bacterium]